VHNFKIGDKVLISNDFYNGKNPKLAPQFEVPGKIIDTNTKEKLNNKIKVLNVNKLKLFLQKSDPDIDTKLQDFSANVSITPGIRQNNLMAIGHSKLFQTISSTDLHSCLHLGDTFFCKGRKVTETSLKKSCLGSLKLANAEAIQNTCKFKVAEASERIFKLVENIWAVYSTGTIYTNQVCQAKNTIQTCQINSGHKVTVEPGCLIRTMDHVISADESEMIEIQKKTMDWPGELAELFGWANTEGIHTAIQGLMTKYNGEFNASKLFKELDQIQPA